MSALIKQLKIHHPKINSQISMVVVSFYPNQLLLDQVAYCGVLGFNKDNFMVGKWKIKNFKH